MKVKAYTRDPSKICPKCPSKYVGVICFVNQKFICVLCKHEWREE
jgi:hypothetical protein